MQRNSGMQRVRVIMPSAGELIPLSDSHVPGRITPRKSRVAEIAPDVHPISTLHPAYRLQFNPFLSNASKGVSQALGIRLHITPDVAVAPVA